MNTKCKGKPPLFQRLPRKGSLLVLLLSFVFCFAAFSMALASEPATSTAAKIQLNKAAVSCDAGEAYQLNATFDSTPVSTDSAPKVTWSSSDSSVATVDANGKVTAIAHGSATITCALANNKDVSAACNITVAGNLIDAKTISEFQSPHPYNPDSRDCWRYTATPFASILVLEFDAKTFAEKDFDCIEVSGADGKLIQRFTADELASGEVYVDGNVACVRVVSDAAINEWGFAVVSVTPIVFDGWYELAGNVYYYRDNEMQKGIVDADGVLYHFDDETGAFIDVYTPPATEEVPVVVPDPEFEYPVLPDAGGPAVYKMPYLLGMFYTDAEAQLESMGIIVDELWIYDDFFKTPWGTVTSQNPNAGMDIAATEHAQLEISLGRSPVEVPDVVGMDVTDAYNTLIAAEFWPKYAPAIPTSDPALFNKVAWMDPPGGSLASPDTGITICLYVNENAKG